MSLVLAAGLLAAMAPGVASAAPTECPRGGAWSPIAFTENDLDVGNTNHEPGDFVCARVNRGLTKKVGDNVHVISYEFPV